MRSDHFQTINHGFDPGWRETYCAGQPLRIGQQTQFLWDDWMVEDRYGLRRVQGRVEKWEGNPLPVEPASPWDEGVPQWGQGVNLTHVLFDPEENIYKGWYCLLHPQPGVETGYTYSTLYAESDDGTHWRKPELGLCAFEGHARTNFVLHREKGTCLLEHIERDEQADPQHRYVALVKTVPPGETDRCLVRMTSPDGRKWTLAERPILFRGASDGPYTLVHDAARERWLLYRRPPTNAMKREGFFAKAHPKRRSAVCVSTDLHNWSQPRTLALPDENDVADIDSIYVKAYEGIFIGFLGLMDNPAVEPKHMHLLLSRDGFSWNRLPERPRFIPNGEPGAWDAGAVTMAALLPEGDRIRIYYWGMNTPQGDHSQPRHRRSGLAFMGRDRFVGQRAGPEGGYLLTRQFVLEGTEIEINSEGHGEDALIQAEILQPAVEHYECPPYDGHAMAASDAAPLRDEFRRTLRWNGSADLTGLRGKTVILRFFLRNATLYTFRVHDDL